ncbi:MAG: rod shape-determining protein MreC [Eubacteriales bacterium]|nr:rod shape-determining protein MreC [Eubacteriales bacterium]
MKKKQLREPIKSKTLLFILSLLSGIIIILSFVLDFSSNPLNYVSGYVLTPLQSGINQVGGWLSGKMDYFEDILDLVAENEKLQEQVNELTVENTQLLQDHAELNSLRDLYALDHQYESYEKVGARVISRENAGNWFSEFTIDKGENDGLAVDMNVLSGAGLAGIIIEVGPNWSKVRAVIDDYSNVSAEISETSDTCIIAGSLDLIDEGKINLVKLEDPESKAKAGDTVITSHISDKFLPGILIGYISDIQTDANNLTRSGYISPAVDFKSIKEVLVIKNLKQSVD